MPQKPKRTLIMGVINLTPDSFSNDGRLRKEFKPSDHLRFARKLIKDGADIIDIGAESSRPGAKPISVKTELARLIPTLRLLTSHCKVPISVDTYKPEVAEEALEAGASIINNIRGLNPNKALVKCVARFNAFLVLMHMRGTPLNMQKKVLYTDLMNEMINELRASVEFCLENGIKKDRIIIDPGIGFSKTMEGNLEILRFLDKMRILGCPILIGVSRKSFIGTILNQPVGKRVMGTAASVAVAIAHGANIVRVHDVALMKEIVQMTDAIMYKQNYV